MRYHAHHEPPSDRAVAAELARWLQSRQPTSTASLDLAEQMATFWRDDDLRALRRARRAEGGDEGAEGMPLWSRAR